MSLKDRVEFEGFLEPAIKSQVGDDFLRGLISAVCCELVDGRSDDRESVI